MIHVCKKPVEIYLPISIMHYGVAHNDKTYRGMPTHIETGRTWLPIIIHVGIKDMQC